MSVSHAEDNEERHRWGRKPKVTFILKGMTLQITSFFSISNAMVDCLAHWLRLAILRVETSCPGCDHRKHERIST